jgi:hypothetical protein
MQEYLKKKNCISRSYQSEDIKNIFVFLGHIKWPWPFLHHK